MSDAELRATISRLMRGLNHDLKNPLGAADGYVDLLLQGFRGELSDEQRQTLERVRTLIATGVGILEDVVAYARAAIGELRVHPADTDLKAVVRMALDRHAARATEAGITVDFKGPEGPVRLKTDADVVGQIVHRLVENALDHAPDGGRVEVGVASEGDGATVRVSDNGPGIAEEDRERLLLPFEHGAPPARPRESAGIGFGLSLAEALARTLGGALRLEDGSSFVLELR